MKDSSLRKWLTETQRNLLGPDNLQYIFDNFRRDRRNLSKFGRIDIEGSKLIPGDYSSHDLRLFELINCEFNECFVGKQNLMFLLDYAKFFGLALDGIINSNVDLSGVNFNGYKLQGLSLDGVKLDRIALESLLYHARAKEIEFNGTNFSGLKIAGAEIKDPILGVYSYVFSDLRELRFEGCNFDSANLEGADLSKSLFIKCSFKGAKIQASLAQAAAFIDCDFSDAELLHVDFKESDFTGAKFNNTRV